MPFGKMTVGDLRKKISDLDDSVTLVIYPDAEDFMSCEPYTRIKIPGKPAKVWNYNTRFVSNIYTANDDRLDNSQILNIVIGKPLP